MNALESAWNALAEAAIAFGQLGTTDAGKALANAADAYAKARWSTKTQKRPESPASGMTVPFGRAKGRTIGEADTRDLQWVLKCVNDSIDDAAKQRWRESNERLANAIQHELELRGKA